MKKPLLMQETISTQKLRIKISGFVDKRRQKRDDWMRIFMKIYVPFIGYIISIHSIYMT